MDHHPVFISYAQSSSLAQAETLYRALDDAGIKAFLDRECIDNGDPIGDEVFDAVLNASVLVALADKTYFTRRYCVEELGTALAPYRALYERERGEEEIRDALLALVVGVPGPDGQRLDEMHQLPPEVQDTKWPRADDSAALVRQVRRHLDRTGPVTIGDRLERLGERGRVRDRLREWVVIPAPARLDTVPLYHEFGLAPSIGDAFVGRSRELWDLNSTLVSRQTTTALVTRTVEAAGGFGKTRLALEYLHRYGPREYPGGLFWVEADVPPDRLEAQLHGILRVLVPATPDLPGFKAARRDVTAELREALRNRAASQAVLYVVDNVPEPEAGQPLPDLANYCPALGQVAVLVTSRARQTVNGGRALLLRELSQASAVRLLTWNVASRVSISERSWREIADWLGRMPLALELINAVLRFGGMSPTELRQSQRDGDDPVETADRHIEALHDVLPAGHRLGIARALDLSYRRLPPEARGAAGVLAWMSPDPIPATLVSDPDTFPPAARTSLISRSFVTEVHVDPVARVGLYGRMHRVIADYLRVVSVNPGAQVDQAGASLYRELGQPVAEDPATWPLLVACRPHAESVYEHGRKILLPRSPAGVRSFGLALALVKVLVLTGRHGPASAWARRCLDDVRAGLGETHVMTRAVEVICGAALAAAGSAVEAQGILASLREGVESLHMVPVPIRESAALSVQLATASTLVDQGHLDRAREIVEEALAGCRSTFGEEHRYTVMVTYFLASVMLQLGRATDARHLLEWVVDRQGGVGAGVIDGPLGRASAVLLLWLAMRNQGEAGRADAVLEAELAAVRELAAEADPDEPDSPIHQLHSIERVLGTMREASTLEAIRQGTSEQDRARVLGEQRDELARAARAVERAYGPGHALTISALCDQAANARFRGDLPAAREHLEEGLRRAREHQGEGHSDTIETMTRLAVVLREQGELEGAAALTAEVLERHRSQLGDAHPDTLRSMVALARLHHQLGNGEPARKLAATAVEACQRMVEAGTTDAVRVAEDLLGFLVVERGDVVSGSTLAALTLAACQRVHGAGHPVTMRIAVLARELDGLRGAPVAEIVPPPAPFGDGTESLDDAFTRVLGRARDASPDELRGLLDRCARVRGAEAPLTLILTVSLGMRLDALGMSAEVVELLGPALPAIERELESSSALQAMAVLGVALYRCDDHAGAEALLERAARRALDAMADGQQQMPGGAGMVASALAVVGQLERAGEVAERAMQMSGQMGSPELVTSALGSLLEQLGRGPAVIARLLEDPEAPAGVLREALDRCRSLRGERDAATFLLTLRLGARLIQEGEAGAAVQVLGTSLPAIRDALGRDHDIAVLAMQTLSVALVERNDAPRARWLLEEALEICRATRGAEHEQTRRTQLALAQVTQVLAERDGRPGAP